MFASLASSLVLLLALVSSPGLAAAQQATATTTTTTTTATTATSAAGHPPSGTDVLYIGYAPEALDVLFANGSFVTTNLYRYNVYSPDQVTDFALRVAAITLAMSAFVNRPVSQLLLDKPRLRLRPSPHLRVVHMGSVPAIYSRGPLSKPGRPLRGAHLARRRVHVRRFCRHVLGLRRPVGQARHAKRWRKRLQLLVDYSGGVVVFPLGILYRRILLSEAEGAPKQKPVCIFVQHRCHLLGHRDSPAACVSHLLPHPNHLSVLHGPLSALHLPAARHLSPLLVQNPRRWRVL
ncbi:hypothetical protein DFJ73DRAFT_858168 [Zopfochytrium polystomum]|nr:hypothetical protein DFJ73DRAFT_858168 [Zopfochytrium polystomum]